MQTVKTQIRLLLSVLSASTLFCKVELLAFKHFSKQQNCSLYLDRMALKVLLSDSETRLLFLSLLNR